MRDLREQVIALLMQMTQVEMARVKTIMLRDEAVRNQQSYPPVKSFFETAI